MGLGLALAASLPARAWTRLPEPMPVEIEAIEPDARLEARMAPYRMVAFRLVPEEGRPMDALLSRPEEGVKGPVPLVLFLHGIGEAGPGLERMFRQPAFLHIARPPLSDRHPCYVYAPQHPAGHTAWISGSRTRPVRNLRLAMSGLFLLMERADPPIDPERVYVTGLSSGAMGAFEAVKKYPRVFAGATLVSTPWAADTVNPDSLNRFWTLLTRSDYERFGSYVEEAARALNAAGGEARVSHFPGRAGHDAWNLAYREPQVWAWLFAQRRTPVAGALVPAPAARPVGLAGEGMRVSALVPARPDRPLAFATDGLLATAYVAERPRQAGDWVQVDFRQPVRDGEIVAHLGDERGRGPFGPVVLEATTNRARYRTVAEGTEGTLRWTVRGGGILAVRVRAAADGDAPLAVREIQWIPPSP